MNKLAIYTLIVIVLSSCNSKINTSENMENQNSQSDKSNSSVDTIPKVVGVGGIFFYSNNPEESNEWYSKNLGFEINDWGSSSFDFRNIDNAGEVNSLQWKAFKNGDEYFSPSKKEFMVNYQVQNIEGLVAKLKSNGVNVLDSIATYDYGKFVHLLDNEGRKIELWEPIQTNKK